MILKQFINELGNKVKIRIKNKKVVAVNYETKEEIDFNGVSISIQGPTSEGEFVVTYKEAEEIFLTLKKYLKKK